MVVTPILLMIIVLLEDLVASNYLPDGWRFCFSVRRYDADDPHDAVLF